MPILAIIVGIVSVIMGLSAGGAIGIVLGLVFLGGGIWWIAHDQSDYEQKYNKYRSRMAESEKRLSNPEYANTLKELGIDVPKRYLRQ